MTFRQKAAVLVALWTAIAFVLLGGGGSIIAEAPPFKADKPCVISVYDASPTAVAVLTRDHAGQADILGSLADGSARQRVLQSGGEWRLLDKAQDVSDDAQWVKDARAVWELKGNPPPIPWIVAAGKTGGINRAPPDGTPAQSQGEMLKLLAPLGVK